MSKVSSRKLHLVSFGATACLLLLVPLLYYVAVLAIYPALLTSLVDRDAYPVEDLVRLYHERWEIELGFAEKKTHMLARKEALRIPAW